MATATIKVGRPALPKQLKVGDLPAHIGGEGSIYFSTDDHFVVKIYHHPSPEKPKLLEHVLSLGTNLGADEQFLAWPLGIVSQLNGKPVVGVVTRRVSPDFVPLYKLVYSPMDAVAQFRKGHSWLEYVKMARATAAAVRAIHGLGMAHADIHFKNFLAHPHTGEVVLIDLDGLVVSGFLPPQVKGMRGFIAPEVVTGEATPDETTDRHSLAVLILWILLWRNVMQPQVCYDPDDPNRDDELGFGKYACFSENPNDRRNWLPQIGVPLYRKGALSYRALPPKLQQLTERALIQGLCHPATRPQAVEWERALAEAYDVLVPCLQCRQTFFYPYWLNPPQRRRCPFCGYSVQPPLPAVLDLLEPRSKGTYICVRTIALYHGLPLFEDVAEPSRTPPFTRRDTPVIAQAEWESTEGSYRLINMGVTPWRILSGGSGAIAGGESVALKRGLLLSLGDGKRVVRVTETGAP